VALLLFMALVAYAPPSVATVLRTVSHNNAASLTSARADALTPHVVMAPGVVVVNAATVAADLVSVSSDGGTFVFKSPASTLSQLAPGKVMLLQGYTVAVVASVSRSGSRLTVTTRPAALTDIFKTANISFSQPIDFSNVFGTLSPGSPPSDPAGRMSSPHPEAAFSRAVKPVVPDVGLSYVARGRTTFPTVSR